MKKDFTTVRLVFRAWKDEESSKRYYDSVEFRMACLRKDEYPEGVIFSRVVEPEPHQSKAQEKAIILVSFFPGKISYESIIGFFDRLGLLCEDAPDTTDLDSKLFLVFHKIAAEMETRSSGSCAPRPTARDTRFIFRGWLHEDALKRSKGSVFRYAKWLPYREEPKYPEGIYEFHPVHEGRKGKTPIGSTIVVGHHVDAISVEDLKTYLAAVGLDVEEMKKPEE